MGIVVAAHASGQGCATARHSSKAKLFKQQQKSEPLAGAVYHRTADLALIMSQLAAEAQEPSADQSRTQHLDGITAAGNPAVEVDPVGALDDPSTAQDAEPTSIFDNFDYGVILLCIFQFQATHHVYHCFQEFLGGDDNLETMVQVASEVDEWADEGYCSDGVPGVILQLIDRNAGLTLDSVKNAIQKNREVVAMTTGLDTTGKLARVVGILCGWIERATGLSAQQQDKALSILERLEVDCSNYEEHLYGNTFETVYENRFNKMLTNGDSFIMPMIGKSHAAYALFEPSECADHVMFSVFNGGDYGEHFHVNRHTVDGTVLLECCICQLPCWQARLIISMCANVNLESLHANVGQFLNRILPSDKDTGDKSGTYKVNGEAAFNGQYEPYQGLRVCIEEQEVGNCAFHNLWSALRHYMKAYKDTSGKSQRVDLALCICLFTQMQEFLCMNEVDMVRHFDKSVLDLAHNVLAQTNSAVVAELISLNYATPMEVYSESGEKLPFFMFTKEEGNEKVK